MECVHYARICLGAGEPGEPDSVRLTHCGASTGLSVHG